MEAIKDKIEALLKPVEAEEGIFLVEIKVNESQHLVKVLVDKIPGVTIQDCVKVSRRIEAIMNLEMDFSGLYSLEVSSAGADQPFKVPQQYQQYLNRYVEVQTNDSKKIVGVLAAANDATLTVLAEDVTKKPKKKTE
ncbi:MAG TPA: hypothetical protein VEY71_02075, partial [Chitinophagales bacterium]|nr:hypothetical protein [Chitinophagales bacterium]